MATWTLIYGGVEKSFAAWGLRDLRRRQSSQSQYQVTFTAQRIPFDGAPQFAYGSIITIRRNGVQWWKGPVVSIPKYGGAQSERIDYIVASPWWYLENITYQQAWAYFTGTGYTKKYSSHLFLGQTIQWYEVDGVTPLDLPQQIKAKTNVALKEILDYAIARSPSGLFTYASADLLDTSPQSIYIPPDEAREINCAEAVRRITKWLRDLVVWWDFTAATPVLHFQRRPALTVAALTIGSKPLANIELTPRYDLQVSSVCLKYEKTDQVDDNINLSITEMIAPAGATGEEVGAMVCTIDLKGIQASNVYGSLTSAAIDVSSVDWWKLRYPWMDDDSIEEITITDPARTSSLPRELVTGSWAPWMTGVSCEQDTITATARVKYKPGATTEKIDTKKLSAKIAVTNSALGIIPYSTTASFDPGDEIPAGLHTDIYNSLQPLQYSGRISLRERECGDWLTAQLITPQSGIGLKINVAGGTGAYASVGAMVQACDEDIDTGTTSLTVGPPEQLSPQDLVALLQVTRTRFVYNNPKTQAQGISAAGGNVQYPKETARESANSHTTGYEKLTISTPTTGGAAPPVLVIVQGSHKCEINLADLLMALPGGDVKPSVKFRKLKYCKGNVQKSIWVLCSALYNDDGSSAGEP